jgi:hypothetical protein
MIRGTIRATIIAEDAEGVTARFDDVNSPVTNMPEPVQVWTGKTLAEAFDRFEEFCATPLPSILADLDIPPEPRYFPTLGPLLRREAGNSLTLSEPGSTPVTAYLDLEYNTGPLLGWEASHPLPSIITLGALPEPGATKMTFTLLKARLRKDLAT